MRRFQDKNDRLWDLEINVWTVIQLRKMLGIDLTLITTLAGIAKITEDPTALVEALQVCCKRQIETAGLDESDFASGFAGDALLEASDAFIQSWIDLQPDPEERDVMRNIVIKARETQYMVYSRAHESLMNLDFSTFAKQTFIKQLSAE